MPAKDPKFDDYSLYSPKSGVVNVHMFVKSWQLFASKLPSDTNVSFDENGYMSIELDHVIFTPEEWNIMAGAGWERRCDS